MSVDVKIVVVGACKSGKTAISNFIADAVPNAENPSLAPSKPTVGCRILEFDRQTKRPGGGGQVNVNIELWDVSGDRKYEDVWPAIRHNGIGLIMVFDGEKSDEDLDSWFKWFAVPMGLKESQCLVFAHFKSADNIRSLKSAAKTLAKIHFVTTTLEQNQTTIKDEFDRFLVHLVAAAVEKRERDEASVLNN